MYHLIGKTIESVVAPYTGELVALVAFITAVVAFKKQTQQVWCWFLGLFKSIFGWFTAPMLVIKRLTEQDKILSDIKAQIYPNGGASLSDRLDRVLTLAKKAERRSLILSESSDVATFECDESGYCIWGNSALAHLFGMERSELLGTKWLTAIDSHDRAKVWSAFQEAIKSRIPYSCEYVVVNQETGERTKCFASAEIPQATDGKIIFIHGTVVPMK